MTIRTERRRDNQQWMLDHMVKTTGRVINFAYDQRAVPPEVKSYPMIPRVMEKHARHTETIARAAEAAGHHVTAAELYFRASEEYREGQHAIFADDNPEKIYLHGKLLECFEKVIEYAPHPIERVEIPFEGDYLQGVLHLLPDRPKAPTVLFVPGMDMTKEAILDPLHHPFIERGLNCLHIDGPGQGTSNIRKIRITHDNYRRAGKAAIDWLVRRPEIFCCTLAGRRSRSAWLEVGGTFRSRAKRSTSASRSRRVSSSSRALRSPGRLRPARPARAAS
jgi:hypothetical protein